MTTSSVSDIVARQAVAAKAASRALAALLPAQKASLLNAVADALSAASSEIVFHNEIDVEAARQAGLNSALIERLVLTEKSVKGMAQAVRDIAAQPDPIGEVLETLKRPNGLVIEKIRVPLGVVAMVYESRPNVTVDAAALCLKSGNAVLLRGGSEAINSNRILVQTLVKAGQAAGLP
jgi:glutamate-5-semialdehyde dehydrogenase